MIFFSFIDSLGETLVKAFPVFLFYACTHVCRFGIRRGFTAANTAARRAFSVKEDALTINGAAFNIDKRKYYG